jgi:hypothetical protein
LPETQGPGSLLASSSPNYELRWLFGLSFDLVHDDLSGIRRILEIESRPEAE